MNEITFNVDREKWVMKINDNGIFFNREQYPNASPDDFAQAVIEILERNYDIIFTKRDASPEI